MDLSSHKIGFENAFREKSVNIWSSHTVENAFGNRKGRAGVRIQSAIYLSSHTIENAFGDRIVWIQSATYFHRIQLKMLSETGAFGSKVRHTFIAYN